MEAESGRYKVLQQNYFYNRVVAEKASDILSHKNSKINLVSYFEAALLSETSDLTILEINAGSLRRKVTDTLRKRRLK